MNDVVAPPASSRRGPRRGKVALQASATAQGIPFVVSILQRSRGLVPKMTAMERIQVLAARESGDAGSAGVSKLLRISVSAADSLVVGKLQVTEKVLVSATRATDISAHWILTGEGSKDPRAHSPNSDEEMLFIRSMRTLDRSHALRVLFSLDLDAVVCVLNEPHRTRFLASLHRLIGTLRESRTGQAAFGQTELEHIGKNVAQSAFTFNIDLSADAGSMFTPLHEAVGIFGPERSPTLLDLLS